MLSAEEAVRANPEEEARRWGGSVVDPRSRDLPGLKMSYVLQHLLPQGRVIEIGCGEGKVLKTLAKLSPDLELHGTDARDASAAADGYTFHHAPDGKVPLPDHSFDAVLIVDVLEHVSDPRALLREARRLLRPDGRLVAVIPVEGEPVSFYTLFRLILGKDTYVISKDHVQAFTHERLVALLREFFELSEQRYAYHAIGQLLDASFFAAARLKSIQRFWWRDNVYYNPGKNDVGRASSAMNKLLQLGNLVAWSESTLLAKSKLGAAATLVVAAPRPD